MSSRRVRLALSDVVTLDDLRDTTEKLAEAIERLEHRLDASGRAACTGSGASPARKPKP